MVKVLPFVSKLDMYPVFNASPCCVDIDVAVHNAVVAVAVVEVVVVELVSLMNLKDHQPPFAISMSRFRVLPSVDKSAI